MTKAIALLHGKSQKEGFYKNKDDDKVAYSFICPATSSPSNFVQIPIITISDSPSLIYGSF